jgi:phosphoglycerate kinase
VSLSKDRTTITDDTRIKETLSTINLLLKHNNKLIIIAHLGRPENRSPQFSLKIVADRLQKYLLNYQVVLIEDFLTNYPAQQLSQQIFLLENIRFYPQEKKHGRKTLLISWLAWEIFMLMTLLASVTVKLFL